MLPTEGGQVLEKVGVGGLAVVHCGVNRSLDINSISESDGGCDQGQSAGTIALLLKATVADFTLAAEEDSAGQGVAGFALVESCMNAAAQLHTLEP
jgi:hypothetical protein